VSFAAYLFGALLSFPTESRVLLARLGPFRRMSADALLTADEYERFVQDAASAAGVDRSHRPHKSFRFRDPPGRAADASIADLRTRLLVANQELYGEYDRLAAEANFRVNIFLPLMAFYAIALREHEPLLATAIFTVGCVLLFRGGIRMVLAVTVIQRAALNNEIEHPIERFARINEEIDRRSKQRERAK
jgi:hypothetical protein